MLTAVTTPLMPSPATGSTGQRSLLTAYTVVSGALVVSVMVQAAMAGQALFEGFDIEIHGYVGNASFTLGIVGLALALFGRMSKTLTLLAALVLLALFTQTGLGYVGRETTVAASLHVPLGVLTFGLVAIQATWAVVERQRSP
jgi:hypothetical protein